MPRLWALYRGKEFDPNEVNCFENGVHLLLGDAFDRELQVVNDPVERFGIDGRVRGRFRSRVPFDDEFLAPLRIERIFRHAFQKDVFDRLMGNTIASNPRHLFADFGEHVSKDVDFVGDSAD